MLFTIGKSPHHSPTVGWGASFSTRVDDEILSTGQGMDSVNENVQLKKPLLEVPLVRQLSDEPTEFLRDSLWN